MAGHAAAGHALTPYWVILRSRLRSQAAYRRSFALEVVGSFLVGIVDLAELYVLFSAVDSLGGLRLPAALLVFGMAAFAFGTADLLIGHVDRMPMYIRTGTLDALLLRPLPVLAQLATSDVQLRRFGRVVVAAAALAVGVHLAELSATPATVALVSVTLIAGTAIFCALFVSAAALQFWLVDAAEVVNSFTYGSNYISSYSGALLTLPMRVFVTFVVPAMFVAYLPTLALVGLPGPAGTPAWLGYLSPIAALVACGVAAGLWRVGLAHYTGTGS